ncbi:MAG TPA: tetratricopeptide repeat protein, partial [Thermoanaerobaculia bacterium]|nr:tetratricopeptide repeat protein [Thermoanaerobaculia bacterium]
ELDAEIRTYLTEKVHRAPDERRRVDQVQDLIFNRLDLQYALFPTRNAVETYRSREGNCLSFVNLFVGIARHQGLNPAYYEVNDLQRWNRREGLVVSQGHIVAGMMVKGKLSTFDFLPYRPKSYRDFKQIDDVTAAAHFYNNIGAEALMEGDVDRAVALITTATRIAPRFDKAINNLGVCHARRGEYEKALEIYQRGLAIDPDNTLILSNVARAYQQMGRPQEALALLEKIEGVNTTNPYFYLYQGELALADGKTDKAIEYMKRALKQDSEVPEVHLGFVKVYMALGEMENARHHLSRALRLDATNREALEFARLLGEIKTK